MAVATKATAVVVVVVVADMAAALAAKAPVAVVAVVAADVDAAALAATADQLVVKRFWSIQKMGSAEPFFYARKNSVTKGSEPTWRLQWPCTAASKVAPTGSTSALKKCSPGPNTRDTPPWIPISICPPKIKTHCGAPVQ